jgi:hypothetical protein
MIQGLGLEPRGSGCRVQGLGFNVQGDPHQETSILTGDVRYWTSSWA